jgi:molybdopterin-guanine dinucleotide biosynthesis protein A
LRYGRNKALEVFEGQRLVDRGVEALRRVCSPVFVVANDLTPYLDVHASLLRDLLPFQGPLGGIYTALLFSPNDWVVVRATDMPLLVPEALESMLALANPGDADAVVPLTGEKYEPLFALYHRRCIPAIADVLAGPRRNVISFFTKIRLRRLEEDEWRQVDPGGLSFRNVNTPEDWSSL